MKINRRSKRGGAASRTVSSKSTNTDIDDLPDQLLVEILCRLPSYKYVFRCKHWNTLMADSYFISRFFQNKKTPAGVTHTLINGKGEDLLERLSSSSHKAPRSLLFKSLMSFHHLKQEPVVVATFNDLVLCCATHEYEDYYYICNPFTNQWSALPPPPSHQDQGSFLLPVGFICDVPYYEYCNKNDDNHVSLQLNPEYNCKVVRLVPEDRKWTLSNKFKVEIFSSDTGKWREFIVSSPSKFFFSAIVNRPSFACNGMLYWMAANYDYFLIGLDPFMFKNKSDNYQCNFIKIDKPRWLDVNFLKYLVKGGCLKLADYNFRSRNTLHVFDVNVDQMSRIRGDQGAGKLKLSEEIVNIYSLDEMHMMSQLDINVPIGNMYVLAFDPNDADVLFFNIEISKDIIILISYNIRTRECSKIDNQSWSHDWRWPRLHFSLAHFSLALPSWPTPLPRLPH